MQVLILRGIPGSGKSTFQKNEWSHARVCSADSYFMKDGKYEFDAKRLKDAHGSCLRNFIDIVSMYSGSAPDMVVDNTNISIYEIAPYIAIAQAYGWEHQIITLICDPQVAAKRCVHGVPAEKVKSMELSLVDEMKRFPRHWHHQVLRGGLL